MRRAIILVLDSLGVGASADAGNYGDIGADTLGHIAAACAANQANRTGLRQGALRIPNLLRWGLGAAAAGSRGSPLEVPNLPPHNKIQGAWGHACEISRGKDTPSGHWEICGVPVTFDWGRFPVRDNCFPTSLLKNIMQQGGIDGTLANCHASGTEVIRDYGLEHLHSGWPICYTSGDSVFQIAAHEDVFGLQRLYDLCKLVKQLIEPFHIARVIARPFIGNRPDNFQRTANRRDLTTPPIAPTLLDHVQQAGGRVISVGKIADIFAHQGISHTVKAGHNMALVDLLLQQMQQEDSGLIFVNLVDFDSLFGHRRDVAGYAYALEQLDARLLEIESRLKADDLVLLTADHGCDPTWFGSDHTREHVPVVFFGPSVKSGNLGERASFADMGQTIACHLGLDPLLHGTVCEIF